MQYAQLKKIPNVAWEDIYTGNGVSELINICMSALLDGRRRGAHPLPGLSSLDGLRHSGRRQSRSLCLRYEQSEWYPDLEDIRRKVTDRTKAIVIINPNNPTGALYPREILEQIVEIAREHQLILFSR